MPPVTRIWPTNQGTPSRVSYAAAPTNNTDLDWSYTLPGSPAVTGSVTITFTYDTDADTWTLGGAVHGWTGGDGSPLPGCLTFGGNQGAQANVQTTVQTWEDYGVPVGALVTGVEGSFRFRETAETGDPSNVALIYSVSKFVFPSSFLIANIHAINFADWSSSWQTFTGTLQGVLDTFAPSNTPVFLQMEIARPGLPNWSLDGHIDTVVFTIHYDVTPDTREQFGSPPVVSNGGFVWFTTTNPQSETHLICLNSLGVQQSHTKVTNQDGSDPIRVPFYLATDTLDQCYLVLEDCVKAYSTSGTLLWTHGSTADFSPAFKTAVVADDGFVYVGNWFGPTVVIEALKPADGTIDHSFDTLIDGHCDQFSASGTKLYIGLTPSGGNSGVSSFTTAGVLRWEKDCTTFGNGYIHTDLAPSLSGSHVVCMAFRDVITSFNGCVSLADADGSLEWNYTNIDVEYSDSASIDAGGQVYVQLGANLAGPILAALNIANGAELWRYTATGQFPEGFAASVGNDNSLLVPLPGSMPRVSTVDGSEITVLSGLTSPFPVALGTVDSFIADLTTPGVLYAYGISTPPPSGGGGGIRRAIGSRSPARAVFRGTFWGHAARIPATVPYGLWKFYFKGFVNGEDMSAASYGTPNVFLVNPGSNAVQTQEQAVVDPNGMRDGVPILMKAERDATDPRDTEPGPQGLMVIELTYDRVG